MTAPSGQRPRNTNQREPHRLVSIPNTNVMQPAGDESIDGNQVTSLRNGKNFVLSGGGAIRSAQISA